MDSLDVKFQPGFRDPNPRSTVIFAKDPKINIINVESKLPIQ